MPTKSMLKIPAPKSWEEFQIITKDALGIRFNSTDMSLNGRQGQKQHGVDVYGHDEYGHLIAIECKNYGGMGSESFIDAAIKEAESFSPTPTSFILALASERDAKLQAYVRNLSPTRVAANKFAVGITFWDDLVNDLASSEDFYKHFPDFKIQDSSGPQRKSRLLVILEFSYLGLYLEEYIELIFGEFGLMAGEKPEQVSNLINIIKMSAPILFNDEDSKKIKNLADEIHNFCIDTAYGKISASVGWPEVDRRVTSLNGILRSISTTLEGDELAVYLLGEKLAHCELVLSPRLKKPSILIIKDIERGVKTSISDKESRKEALILVKNLAEDLDSSIRSVVDKIYVACKRGLRDKVMTPL